MKVWNAQKGGERWITFILTFSDFCLQYYQLPLPVICFKNDPYRWRPSWDNQQNAAPKFKCITKSTHSSGKQSMFMLLYALFISFPVRHTDNFRFDGRHCNGDLMARAMIRKLCTIYLTDKVLSTCEPKFQKKETNFTDKTNLNNLFC